MGSGGIQLDLTPTMPQVWFLDRGYEWHYLAPNFTTYFRMMLYHLGLPQWQLLFTPMGPTPWAKVINIKPVPENWVGKQTFVVLTTAEIIFFSNKTFLFYKIKS